MTAEVTGLEEKHIEVLLDDGVLTLKGERWSETRTTSSSPSASTVDANGASRSATRSRKTKSTPASRTAC